MNETSEKLQQQTLWDINTFTSLQVLAASHSEWLEQDIQIASERSQEVSLVLISQMQGNEQELQENKVDFGKKCIDSFKRRLLCIWDRMSSYWRTCQLSLTEDFQPYLGTLPKRGMTVDGKLYVLQTLERHNSEKESLLWPTPTANDAKNATLPPATQEWDSVPGELRRTGHHGNLNPSWVECLQGYPIGWTDLSDGQQDLENNNILGNLQEPPSKNNKIV